MPPLKINRFQNHYAHVVFNPNGNISKGLPIKIENFENKDHPIVQQHHIWVVWIGVRGEVKMAEAEATKRQPVPQSHLFSLRQCL